jgi:hypothetical protein
MKIINAQTYIQNTIADMPNGGKARAGAMTTNFWKQFMTSFIDPLTQ